MPLYVDDVVIPDADLAIQFMRASGPGGQNVNKVSSAVQLRFDLSGTAALPPPVKQRLRALAGHRLSDDGAILIVARAQRSQERNRRDAEQRLCELIRAALVEPKRRIATRPTAGSRRRRLERKLARSATKRGRARVTVDD